MQSNYILHILLFIDHQIEQISSDRKIKIAVSIYPMTVGISENGISGK